MSQQRITQGGTIDVATPAEVAAIIAERENREPNEYFRREKGATQLDGAGNGVITIKTTRMYDWICQRVTLTGGPNTTVEFYENQQLAGDLLEEATLNAAGRYSDSFANTMLVPAGSQLLVVFAGAAGAGLQATLNMQVRLVKVFN